MLKIISAFDGLKFSENNAKWAAELCKSSGAFMVGVFLDDPHNTSYRIFDLVGPEGVSEVRLKKYDRHDETLRKEAAERFKNISDSADINFSIHHDRGLAMHDLLHESIYADLLVIDKSETLAHYPEKPPTRFIRHLLSDVECPVLLTSGQQVPIEQVFFLYDGEPSSVYALKMFSYLFPFLDNLSIQVVTVKDIYEDLHLPDNRLVKDFIKRHFVNATYEVLQGHAGLEIINYLKVHSSNALVVMGAYRRSTMSRMFRPSMADLLMEKIDTPLFIAHS